MKVYIFILVVLVATATGSTLDIDDLLKIMISLSQPLNIGD